MISWVIDHLVPVLIVVLIATFVGIIVAVALQYEMDIQEQYDRCVRAGGSEDDRAH